MLDGLVETRPRRAPRPAEGDRRRVEVTLTAEGRERVAAKRARIAEAREEIFRRLVARASARAAARLLHSLAAAMEDLP